jgi:Uma2 family endonuclease
MTLADPIPLADQQHFVLTGISWDLYERLLDESGTRQIRATYDNGDLEMMAPLPVHELWKKRISRLIELMTADLGIEVLAVGAATFRRKDLAKGLEHDECYYIQNVAAVRGKSDIDLAVDPPPDLAIEIDITHRSIAREPIYAASECPSRGGSTGVGFSR